ncbi:MAG: hypothetical protein ACI9IA_001768 [Enterobacterales bacterium]
MLVNIVLIDQSLMLNLGRKNLRMKVLLLFNKSTSVDNL